MTEGKMFKLRFLKNGAWFYLPLTERTCMKMYGNDTRVRIFTGTKPVIINGEHVFSSGKETDVGPDTEVIPVPTPKEFATSDEGDEEVNLEEVMDGEQEVQITDTQEEE